MNSVDTGIINTGVSMTHVPSGTEEDVDDESERLDEDKESLIDVKNLQDAKQQALSVGSRMLHFITIKTNLI